MCVTLVYAVVRHFAVRLYPGPWVSIERKVDAKKGAVAILPLAPLSSNRGGLTDLNVPRPPLLSVWLLP